MLHLRQLTSLLVAAWLLCRVQVQAAAVFAHFMVTNTQNYSSSDWTDDISKAQAAHIDAFALNMAVGDPANTPGLQAGFAAANQLGFKLFFSFDYAGNGPWKKSDVLSLLNQYASNGAYYHYNGQPFVSTFEGPANAPDWKDIKAQSNCFFIPSWSSLGAQAAVNLGVADGQFNWNSWPWGNRTMNTYVDASYVQFLKAQPYMMLVSPWFYTNLPGYNKNWLWGGNDLWYERWNEVLFLKPEFVEIGTWNDYGESHYIGPVRSNAYAAFDIGKGPINYADGMPHDGWRTHLPFLIDTYKSGSATITQESLVSWYRLNPVQHCSDGATTANTASQLQIEFTPADVMLDNVYFAALLGSAASVSVTIGGVNVGGSWTQVPDGGIGIYRGSAPYNGNTGQVVVTVSRLGNTIAQMSGQSITTNCQRGLNNYNAWVGSASSSASISATPRTALKDQVCIAGGAPGAPAFQDLCSFSCPLGYCPPACYCSQMGAPKTRPPATGVHGYPLDGGDPNFLGLCSFGCTYGHCPSSTCQTTNSNPNLVSPPNSPFNPPAATSGSSGGGLSGLCNYGCNVGFCPRAICSVDSQGPLNPPSAPIPGANGASTGAEDAGLCNFACSRGTYCPAPCLEYASPGYLPRTWSAFGDSYSAGHGAGTWLTTSHDGRDNECARGTGSYPWQFSQFPVAPGQFPFVDFYSCTGNVISNIPAQVNAANGRLTDISMLSIGGNNFNFAKVVEFCVYPTGITSPSSYDYQNDCTQWLNSAEVQIRDNAGQNVYYNFLQQVDNILEQVVRYPESFPLYITGYPKFFASEMSDDDACSNLFFLDYSVFGRNLKMTTANRQRMNSLVDLANQQIRDRVISQRSSQVVFIDIDPLYEGHRFCEPINAQDPKGLDRRLYKSEVYFYDLESDLDETDSWNGPPASLNANASWSTWEANVPADADNDREPDDPSFRKRGILDKFQHYSAFHPTSTGHKLTAFVIAHDVINRANRVDPRALVGPMQYCTGLGTGEGSNSCVTIDANCGAFKPGDSSLPTVYCANGTSYV